MLKRPVVAVEIGNEWLKILGRAASWRSSGAYRLSIQRLSDIQEPVAAVIAGEFRKLGLPPDRVVMCLPRHLVATVRILELPSADPREIQDMINLQIGKHTPYSREEVVASHKIIGSDREGYTKAMLVIAREDLISARWHTLQEAGLRVDKVTLSSEGTFRWYEAVAAGSRTRESPNAMAVVDLDFGYADFIVVKAGRMILTKPIMIGVQQATDDPQAWAGKLVDEFRHALELYQEERKDNAVERIVLTGARCVSAEQAETIRAALNIPVEILEPGPSVFTSARWPTLTPDQARAVSISPLLGTVLRVEHLDIDLTPGEMRVGKTIEEKQKNFTVMGILLASIMMMVSLWLILTIYNKNSYLTRLKEMRRQLQEASQDVENMRRDIDLIRRRLDAEGSALNLLHEIYQLTPKEIYYSNLQVEDKKLVILKGQAQAMSHVFRFVTTLENSPVFDNVQATHTTSKKEGKSESYEFEITCSYNGQ